MKILNQFITIQFFLVIFITPNIGQDNIETEAAHPYLGAVIPPSPNVRSLLKVSEIPVSLYTGKPDIKIPLESITGKTLSQDIVLSYNAGGIKVEDIGGNVGIGWSLNAGGVIARTVRGLPDESQNGYFLQRSQLYNPNESGSMWSPSWDMLVGGALGDIDLEPDVYSFSFGHYSGEFLVDYLNDEFIVKTVPLVPLRIIPDISLNDGIMVINGWEITTEDGTKYRFKEKEYTTTFSPGEAYASTSTSASVWYLSEIISANDDDKISFSYEPGYVEYDLLNSITDYEFLSFSSSGYEPSTSELSSIKNDANKYSIGFFQQNISTRNISQITSKFETIKFNYEYGRDDLSGTGTKLSNIYYYNNSNVSVPLWSYSFAYSYDQKLTLDYLTKHESDKDLVYRFEYNGSTPLISSPEKDHWGYFNNNNATTILPAVLYGSTLYEGAYKGSSDYALRGILNKITYPTGGSVEFEYELHDAVNSNLLNNLGNLTSTYKERQAIIYKDNIINTLKIPSDQIIDIDVYIDPEDCNTQGFSYYNAVIRKYNTSTQKYDLSVFISSKSTYKSIYVEAGMYKVEFIPVGIDPDESGESRIVISYTNSTDPIEEEQFIGGARIKKIISGN